jgi:hypothetical protein
MQVADLEAMINADTKLSAAEKTFLIETAFAMKDGKTFIVSLDLNRGRLAEHQDVDGVVNIGTQGTYATSTITPSSSPSSARVRRRRSGSR